MSQRAKPHTSTCLKDSSDVSVWSVFMVLWVFLGPLSDCEMEMFLVASITNADSRTKT